MLLGILSTLLGLAVVRYLFLKQYSALLPHFNGYNLEMALIYKTRVKTCYQLIFCQVLCEQHTYTINHIDIPQSLLPIYLFIALFSQQFVACFNYLYIFFKITQILFNGRAISVFIYHLNYLKKRLCYIFMILFQNSFSLSRNEPLYLECCRVTANTILLYFILSIKTCQELIG